MKVCTKCGDSKDVTEFFACSSQSSKLRPDCKVCALASSQLARAKKREHHNQKRREWAVTNKSKRADICKRYSVNNKEKIAEYLRQRYMLNRERLVEQNRQWAKKNKEKRSAIDHRRRAKVLAAPGDFSGVDILALYEIQGSVCAACFTSISSGYHIDHIVAISRGGSNYKTNLQLLCKTCNWRKGAKNNDAFLAEVRV